MNDAARKPNTFSVTVLILLEGSFMLSTKVSTTMPMISSIIAAESIVCPTRPLSTPISFSASTVMPTDVAVIIQPMNSALKNFSLPKPSNP